MAKITMYTSDACPFCQRAKRLLDKKGADYDEVHLSLFDPEARLQLAELTGRYTVPQIVVGDDAIGGWDQLKALEDAGELDELLAAGESS